MAMMLSGMPPVAIKKQHSPAFPNREEAGEFDVMHCAKEVD